jgi:hypothetical protein
LSKDGLRCTRRPDQSHYPLHPDLGDVE